MSVERKCQFLAFAAAAAVLLWQTLTVHYNYGGNWTGLFCTGDLMPIPEDLRPGTYFFRNSVGYDGQEYRYIAHDPLFRKGYARSIDDARLRYRRILVPGLAYLLVGGRQKWIDAAFVAAILLSIFLGVYWSARYIALANRPFAWGLIFLLVPATLTSFDRMLVDSMLAALFAGFLVYVEQANRWKLYAVLVLASLTRETGLLLVAGTAGAELLERRYRRALLFATAGIPALAWFIFVWRHTPESAAANLIGFAGVGLVQRLFTVRHVPDAQPLVRVVVPVLDSLALLGLAATYVLAAYLIWRLRRGPVAISASLFLALGLCLSITAMPDAYAYARYVSGLLLLVMLRGIAAGSLAMLVLPLLTSMSIGVGFVSPLLRILSNFVASPRN